MTSNTDQVVDDVVDQAPEKLDPEELLESLNGYEEDAIHGAFGFHLDKLEDNAIRGIRALAFIVRIREGANKKDARHAAMSLTIGELMDMFELEDDEDLDDPLGEDPAPATS